jgi:hypothetical protein
MKVQTKHSDTVNLSNIVGLKIPIQQKELIMEISSDTLRFFINENKRREVGLTDATLLHLKVKKFFCEPLNKAGQCPQNCLKCHSVFRKAIGDIQGKERDVYGTLARRLISTRDNIISSGNKLNYP